MFFGNNIGVGCGGWGGQSGGGRDYVFAPQYLRPNFAQIVTKLPQVQEFFFKTPKLPGALPPGPHISGNYPHLRLSARAVGRAELVSPPQSQRASYAYAPWTPILVLIIHISCYQRAPPDVQNSFRLHPNCDELPMPMEYS